MKQNGYLIYFGLLVILLAGFTYLVPGLLLVTVPLGLVVASLVFKFRPTKYILFGLVALTLIGVVGGHIEILLIAWWILLFILLVVSLVDLVCLFTRVKFEVERTLPGRFAQGQPGEIKVKIRNLSDGGFHASFFDGLPQGASSSQLPWSGYIPGGKFIEVTYEATVKKRGWVEFSRTHIESHGPLRMWSKMFRVGETEKVRVYPNYEPVLQLSLMSMESNPEQMGIIKKNRSGLSKEFHQLRDYHEGDMLSQIDWKASSKRQSLISREYHEQRDQNVILAIDCGRRMRAIDNGLPQFDHCLNAMLLLAYVALKQGDKVGIMAYGGIDRWLPPVKGVEAMTTILNHLFDYQTSSSPSDYGEAVENILVRQRRRSMVIFISNFRGEDTAELIEPIRKLRQKHIVTLGNIRESEVNQAMEEDVHSFDEAVKLAAIQQYIESRELVMKQLKGMNVPSVDSTADKLPVALANQYLAMREMV